MRAPTPRCDRPLQSSAPPLEQEIRHRLSRHRLTRPRRKLKHLRRIERISNPDRLSFGLRCRILVRTWARRNSHPMIRRLHGRGVRAAMNPACERDCKRCHHSGNFERHSRPPQFQELPRRPHARLGMCRRSAGRHVSDIPRQRCRARFVSRARQRLQRLRAEYQLGSVLIRVVRQPWRVALDWVSHCSRASKPTVKSDLMHGLTGTHSQPFSTTCAHGIKRALPHRYVAPPVGYSLGCMASMRTNGGSRWVVIQVRIM